MANYPVLFDFRDFIAGRGFVADVRMHGRGIMTQEGTAGWWYYGVEPGAIAASGGTPLEAYGDFRERLKLYLFDVAKDAGTFLHFRDEIERFMHQKCDETEMEWLAAVKAIRNQSFKPEAPFRELPTRDADSSPQVEVHNLLDKPDTVSAEMNSQDVLAAAA